MTATDQRIAQLLATEMLRSERLRALLLLGLFGVMALAAMAVAALWGDILVHMTGKESLGGLAPTGLAVVLGFEGAMALYFHLLLRRSRVPRPWVLPTATVIEMAMPTLMLYLVTGLLGPMDGLAAPPIFFYFLLIILAPLRMRVDLCLLTGALSAIGYLIVSLPLTDDIAALDNASIMSRWQPHASKAMVFIVAGGLAAFVTRSIRDRHARTLQLMAERQRVVDLFGQHVSPVVVDKLLEQEAELPSETRQVAMMFFDIRSFTTFSESRSPEEVVDFLNRLFEPCVDLIDEHGGVINKFLGDGFMAVFGAPMDDQTAELNATRAALAIVDEVMRLREAGEIPEVGIGIGLHAGPAMTGNVGSRGRKEYTIIGDTVNLASRIESLTKAMDAQLLVSDAVWQAAREALTGEVTAEAQPPVTVKGREEPVVVHKLR